MIKLLDREKKFVIVKMDIDTYENLTEKKQSIEELSKEARNSKKVFHTMDELFYDLEN